ncbi:MAG TPA: AMP-binding protein [Burkholderiaceae bacterium]|jgi:crotonobetaine/carnitine-CoA ligase|nr:AMP-binding protein [Burkholderiaceae bacterium]
MTGTIPPGLPPVGPPVGPLTGPPDYALEERTIGRVLADKARRIAQRTFLLWQGQSHTYAELDAMTSRYANGFAALGIGHGDHVAVMLPNCPEFYWVVWGLGKIGAVAVPLNTAAKGEILRYFIDQSDSVCLVIDDEWAGRLTTVAPFLPKLRTVLHRAPEGAPALPIDNAAVRILPLHAADSGDDTAPPVDRVRHDDTQLIIYTSGTTGPSKGVMCPHSQSLFVGRQMALDYGYRPDDVLYTCLPLFHANALFYSSCAALWADAAIALAPRFSASQFWDDIRASGATQFNSLGAMSNIILQLPPGPHEREHALRQCMVVPMQKALLSEIGERFGVQVTSLFAMSENYAVTVFVPGDRPDKAGSAGSARGASELRIVEDDGTVLAAGQVGEIQMRPRFAGSMMKGYYRMPDETGRAFVDGWFCTGDRGFLDEDGYLYFVDRKKEAIRRRGENISAYEVEMILSKHPAVLEVAAVPVPSELSEDEVMVYVVRKPGSTVAAAELIHFAIEHMNYYMVPRFIDFIDALPKTATEKIEKYKLKQDAVSRRASLWDREREGIAVRR